MFKLIRGGLKKDNPALLQDYIRNISITISTHFTFFSFNFHSRCTFLNDLIPHCNLVTSIASKFEDIIDDYTAFLLSRSKNNSYVYANDNLYHVASELEAKMSDFLLSTRNFPQIYWPLFSSQFHVRKIGLRC